MSHTTYTFYQYVGLCRVANSPLIPQHFNQLSFALNQYPGVICICGKLLKREKTGTNDLMVTRQNAAQRRLASSALHQFLISLQSKVEVFWAIIYNFNSYVCSNLHKNFRIGFLFFIDKLMFLFIKTFFNLYINAAFFYLLFLLRPSNSSLHCPNTNARFL